MIGRMSARRGGGAGGRIIIAVVLAVIAIVGYLMTPKQYNPITQEEQRVALTVEEEIALGLQSRPQMAAEFGGLHRDENLQAQIDAIGQRLVESSDAKDTEYPFDF